MIDHGIKIDDEFGTLKVTGLTKSKSNRNRIIANCICGDSRTYSPGILKKSLSCPKCQSMKVRSLGRPNAGGAGAKVDFYKESWYIMKYRCNSDASSKYSDYGAKGITYPDRWNDFDVFKKEILEELGKPATKPFKLETININNNYQIGNVEWYYYTKEEFII